jgi:hypothetical protein
MNVSPERSQQFDPDTTPANRRRLTGHPDNGHWPAQTPRDSAAILLSQSVARISDAELERMDRSDLIEMARCARSALPREGYLRHLPYMSREQLQQLACLARRSCRLQMQPGLPPR